MAIGSIERLLAARHPKFPGTPCADTLLQRYEHLLARYQRLEAVCLEAYEAEKSSH